MNFENDFVVAVEYLDGTMIPELYNSLQEAIKRWNYLIDHPGDISDEYVFCYKDNDNYSIRGGGAGRNSR